MREQAADPLKAFRTSNVDATLAIANLAVEVGVRRFVFISSIKVNGEFTAPGNRFLPEEYVAPIDPYGISKWEAEQGLHRIAKKTGLEIVIIRPPLVYGPGVKANFAALVRLVKSGLPLPLGAIHNKRSLVSLGNLVDFIITCTSHPAAANQTFLVSDGQDLSTPDLIHGMALAANVPARLLSVPESWLHMAGLLLGRKSAIDRLCSNLQVDSSKAGKLLGWVPPLTVEEGLRRVMEG
jgi:nucleoside-diphosphate-sugar epimerase